MSAPALVMWAVVFLIGVPSAWRNPTAAALVLCWIFGEAVYLITGNSLPVELYIYPDGFVIAAIYAKPEYKPCDMYESTWHQIKCLLTERCPADRAVLLVFPVMWVTYVIDIADYYKWWILWGAAILQFLFASSESLERFWRSDRGADAVSSNMDSLLVAFPRRLA